MKKLFSKAPMLGCCMVLWAGVTAYLTLGSLLNVVFGLFDGSITQGLFGAVSNWQNGIMNVQVFLGMALLPLLLFTAILCGVMWIHSSLMGYEFELHQIERKQRFWARPGFWGMMLYNAAFLFLSARSVSGAFNHSVDSLLADQNVGPTLALFASPLLFLMVVAAVLLCGIVVTVNIVSYFKLRQVFLTVWDYVRQVRDEEPDVEFSFRPQAMM